MLRCLGWRAEAEILVEAIDPVHAVMEEACSAGMMEGLLRVDTRGPFL